MTTAGKVFSILSFLLGIVFLFFVTPVAKKLIDVQKQIKESEDLLEEDKPLRMAVKALESQRLQLVYDLNRLKGKVGAELTKNQNKADAVRSQLSLLKDLEIAEQKAVTSWQKTVGDLKGEIEARTQEKEELEKSIAENAAERDAQSARVAELRDLWKKSQDQLRETLDSMAGDYEKLEKSIPGNSADNRVALER